MSKARGGRVVKVKEVTPCVTIGMVMEYARQQTDKVTEYYETIKILNKNLHETYGLVRMRDDNIDKLRRELQSKGDSLDYYMKLAQARRKEVLRSRVEEQETIESFRERKYELEAMNDWQDTRRKLWRALAVIAVAWIAAMYIIG